MSIKAAIYDLDGTILNSGKKGLVRLGELAERNGLLFSQEIKKRLRKEWGLPPIELITIGFGITKKFAKEIHRQWAEADKIDPIPLVRGVPELLQRNIEKGIINFIFTSRKKGSAFNILRQFKIIDLFEDVVGTNGGKSVKKTGFKKPDPRSIDNLLKLIDEVYGIQKNEVAYIGDEIVDIECSNGAGLVTFGVTSGLKSKRQLIKAGALEGNVFPTVAHIFF